MYGTEKIIPGFSRKGDIEKAEQIYLSAFPDHERAPFSHLLADPTGHIETDCLRENGKVTGMACRLITENCEHISYLAVEENARGRGLGTRFLSALLEKAGSRTVIADLEVPCPGASNFIQREKRLRFYKNAGFRETEVRYRWRGEDYMILAHGGPFGSREWHAFWRELEKYVPTDEL